MTSLPVSLYAKDLNTTKPAWTIWNENTFQSVSYRQSEVHKSLIEIKATANVNSTLSGFITFIEDVNNTPNWLANARESKIITRYTPRKNSFFIKLSNIWPLKARALLLDSIYWQNPDLSLEIKLTDRKEGIAVGESLLQAQDWGDYLRVKIYSAHWKIIPLTPKPQIGLNPRPELLIEYIFTADGRGSVPDWIAEHFALKSIWKSMNNIRHQLPQKKWQQQTVKGITEIPLTTGKDN